MPDRSPAPLVAGGLGRWSQQNGYQEGPGARQGSTPCALESVLVCMRFNFKVKTTFLVQQTDS